MIIFPAIDIKDGKCVRLVKGDFNKMTSYQNSPFDQAKIYFQSGFRNIHIVDLDGALEGKLTNSSTVKEILKCKGEKDIKRVRVFKLCRWSSCSLKSENVFDEALFITRVQINLNDGKKRKLLYFQNDYKLKD